MKYANLGQAYPCGGTSLGAFSPRTSALVRELDGQVDRLGNRRGNVIELFSVVTEGICGTSDGNLYSTLSCFYYQT